MLRRLSALLLGGVLFAVAWSASVVPAHAESYTPINRYFYYPYYYFPHSYWPAMGPKYPEPVGAPCLRPPAYMAFPPFREPHWRYEYWEPQFYHRGFHFWLDQF
jgi:hypothetical protein